METSVSLLIMTRLKIRPDEPEELVAVLQKRGEFNHEILGPESWSHACQLTVHGKTEPDESDLSALWRETKEELGEAFAPTRYAWECATEYLTLIGQINIPGKKIIKHYAIEILPERLKIFRLNASTGGLRLLRQSDLEKITDLPKTWKKDIGVELLGETSMFPDEIQAVKSAFAHFNKTQ